MTLLLTRDVEQSLNLLQRPNLHIKLCYIYSFNSYLFNMLLEQSSSKREYRISCSKSVCDVINDIILLIMIEFDIIFYVDYKSVLKFKLASIRELVDMAAKLGIGLFRKLCFVATQLSMPYMSVLVYRDTPQLTELPPF